MRWRLALGGVLAAAPGPARAAEPPALAYVYVEPNEGASSGGHVALEIGESTYHFQHRPGGTIRLQRDATESFELAYRALGNRSLEVREVAADDATVRVVRLAFEQRLVVESRAFEHHEALARDRAFLGWLATGEVAGARLAVPAAAYYDARNAESESGGGAGGAAVAELARRIDARRGPGAIAARRAALADQLVGLRLDEPGFADRWREHAAAWHALDVLAAPRGLAAGATLTSADTAFALDERARRRIAVHRDRLLDELPELLASRRPDWGVALLVGLARLEALDASLRAGRLLVLDPFDDASPVLDGAAVARNRAALAAVLDERRTELAGLRTAFAAGDAANEIDLSRLEGAAAFAVEIERALDGATPIRRPPEYLLPLRGALLAGAPRPPASAPALAAAAEAAERQLAAHERQLARAHPYDVVRRNCVTEIFRTIGDALAPVEVERSLAFVPYASLLAVEDAWPIVSRRRLSSYREHHLARMRAVEPAGWVALRESNVVTASVAPTGSHGSPFLFFTDDAAWPRPLLGAANVAVGAGAAALGLVLAPFDAGDALGDALDGVLFSAPELAFSNVRKGSYDVLPRGWEQWTQPR